MKGIDGEISVIPIDKLTVSANFECLDGKYVDFPAGFTSVPKATGGNSYVTTDLAGKTTIRSPKFTSSISANYKLPVSFGSLEFGGSYYYNDGFYWEVDNRIKEPAYNLVAADITARFGPDSHYHVRGYGKNLLSAHYSVYTVESSVGDVYAPALPATYGIEFGVVF
jgi:iron complex outermembrane receptor protein